MTVGGTTLLTASNAIYRLIAAAFLAVALTALTASSLRAASGALQQHKSELEKTLPAGFVLVIQPPFIVLGDESAEALRMHATHTVNWAVDKLKLDFFQKDPGEIIDIWLFRDNQSYTNHAWTLFHDVPTTRFGYYSAAHHALVMNIATGRGTLVHEIVHPFMRANFPNCPPWFDEGLASLYEKCREKDGHIQGMINWRLEGLVKAIREGKTISFEKLTALNAQDFYGNSNGANYSQYYGQARYLCYYLQEKGLLVKFYHQFVANARANPSGLSTLKNVLGEPHMDAFKKKWEAFVLALPNT